MKTFLRRWLPALRPNVFDSALLGCLGVDLYALATEPKQLPLLVLGSLGVSLVLVAWRWLDGWVRA